MHDQAKTGLKSGLVTIGAGSFSEWLRGAEASIRSGCGVVETPCGSCTACCRSSMFISIRPEETETIRRIPRALLFPAPGRPKGHLLMGYDDRGHCPMLVNDRCSIYEFRPQTCRTYDCRVFAATEISVDRETAPDIADRVKSWVFQYEDEQSRREQTILRRAARFLQEKSELFPRGVLPAYPTRLAALAIRIFPVFAAMADNPGGARPDAEIVQAILGVLQEPATRPAHGLAPPGTASRGRAPRRHRTRGRDCAR